jgi:hypothetical protein
VVHITRNYSLCEIKVSLYEKDKRIFYISQNTEFVLKPNISIPYWMKLYARCAMLNSSCVPVSLGVLLWVTKDQIILKFSYQNSAHFSYRPSKFRTIWWNDNVNRYRMQLRETLLPWCEWKGKINIEIKWICLFEYWMYI